MYTSHGPTLLAPTWCISRALFRQLGGFNQQHSTGFPEDLEFFYRALDCGAILDKVHSYILSWILKFIFILDSRATCYLSISLRMRLIGCRRGEYLANENRTF